MLPGAQQLELLRRVNESLATGHAADASTEASTRLADRVLSAPAAGRGKPDLALAGVGTHDFGPRPVDPGELPARELVRVATTLLAEDLVALGVAPEREPLGRPWRRRHRLIGDPFVVGRLTPALKARGRPQGGPLPHVVVAAGPMDELLAHTWTQRCFEHGTMPWLDWLRYWRERDQLPPRLDLATAAARWTHQPRLVRIVTDRSRLAGELGVRRVPPVTLPGADAAELSRRVAALVGLLVPADRRPALMSRTWLARVPPTDTAPVVVPPGEREWIERAADRVARQVRRAGYPVVGDLADLAPRFSATSVTDAGLDPRELDGRVLDLAVRMLIEGNTEGREGR